MATKVGSLIISMALESGAFKSGLSATEKQLKASAKRMEALGKSMKGLGQSMSLAVTLPLAALGKVSIDAALQSADALAQVNASLKSMGGAAGRTAEQLQALASNEMRNSLYDDDDILKKVTANLLTFGNVSGQVFDQAQQAAIDLSAKFGQDLQSSTIQLGKALNDPIKGITALTRAGVSFTEQQKAQIAAMVAVGDTAGAQRIILAELNKEVGGAAAAQAQADPFAKLKHSINTLKEAIGKNLLDRMGGIIDKLTGLVESFNNASPAMQNLVVNLGLIAAAVGPVAYVVGSLTTLMAPFTGALSLIAGEGGLLLAVTSGFAGLGAALAPIAIPLAAVAAAGVLIYSQWDKIGPLFSEIGQSISDAFGPVSSELVTTISRAFDDFMGSDIAEFFKQFADVLGNISAVLLKAFGGAIPGIVKAFGAIVSGSLHVVIDALTVVGDLLTGNWSGAWTAAKKLVMDALFAMSSVTSAISDAIVGYVKALYEGVSHLIGDKLNMIWNDALRRIESVKKAFFDLYDAVVGHSYVPDMVDGIALHMARLDAVMVNPAKSATEQTKQAFQQLASDLQGIMGELFPDARNLADFQTKLDKLNQGIKAGGAGGYSVDQLQAGRQRLIDGADPAVRSQAALPLADIMRLIPDSLTSAREMQSAFDLLGGAANDNADGVETANVRIVKSFKDMADATLQSLQGVVGAIKGGSFLDILGAVIGFGLQLGSVGAFGKGIQGSINAVPHAAGTTFHSGGLALVGERGPELINLPRGSGVVPNHALGRGGGGNTYNFSGNLLTPEFWAQINAGDARAAQAGAMGGQARVAFANSRRVA